jgi:4'-phosphopantetheinyl transferase
MRPDSGNSGSRAGALHLWCAYPDDLLREEAAQACAALLSDDERARWERFRLEYSRREYLATHALARTALARYCDIAAGDLRFAANRHGKPALEPDCGVRFNLSNSGGLVVCLVGEGAVEVGVDVEPYARADQITNVGHKVFSPAEWAQLEGLPPADLLDRSLSLWTLKEAYIKARGVGMSLPLDRISFLFEGEDRARLELDSELGDDARRWWFCLLDYAEHRVAVMAEGDVKGEMEIWEARPPLAAPRPVKAKVKAGAILRCEK